MPAESAILQAGIEAAMESSVFDSPSASCSKTGEDIFIGLGSSEAMGGATLRDTYAKAWELHREPLIWTPRGPGAGVGASTWTLTPASFAAPGRQTRGRSLSDASEARSSIIGYSPCFVDAKFHDQPSPLPDTGAITSSPPSSALLPSIDLERPTSHAKKRSVSCTRSHISSTTAATVSECSTTQELNGIGLGLSFSGSTWSRPATPAESCFADNELEKEVVSKGKRTASYRLLGAWGRVPSGNNLPRREPWNQVATKGNFKQPKTQRPNITPLQRMQPPAPRRVSPPQGLMRTSSASNNTPTRNNVTDRLVADAPSKPHDRCTPLRRVQSAAVLDLSPGPKVPLVGPVPASRRVSSSCRTVGDSSQVHKQDKQATLPTRPSSRAQLASTPATPRTANTSRCAPGTPQSRIPRPASRAGSISGRTDTSARAISSSPGREPQQLLTPTSTVRRVRERASFSQAPRPTTTRPRTQSGRSTQERPLFSKDTRTSRPPSRPHLAAGSSSVMRHQTKRSDSITSVSTTVDRWETLDVQAVAV
ncbi:hypothetical protein BDV93DRAFT_125522 [Ceratobasidium sp. AG-I]|nr:hypothetical protein BDV93DRAFT_125522 [Ceratobasidium sp. AG-I]